jgi:hypothetical protein
MRPLLQLAKLLDDAKTAKTPEQTQLALVAVVQYLYDNEAYRERSGNYR